MRGVVAFYAGRAELHQERVHLRVELDDAMRIALDDVDVAVPINRPRVLPVGIDLLAVDLLVGAGGDHLAVGVEHHHRLGAAIEHVDAIVLIDCQAADTGLVRRPLAGVVATTTAATCGATCRGLRFTLRRRRRRRLLAEEIARWHRRPVRHQLVAAVSGRRDRRALRGHRDQRHSRHSCRDRQGREENFSSHILLRA